MSEEGFSLEDWGADVTVLLHAARWSLPYEGIVYRIRQDQQFALEMRLCNDWHIPHSKFLKWDREDQEKALAQFAYERQRCTNCGIHPDDWPDHTIPMFDAVAETCPGCAERARYERYLAEQAEKMPKSATDGLRVVLKRRDD